jgi:hypothetical protein
MAMSRFGKAFLMGVLLLSCGSGFAAESSRDDALARCTLNISQNFDFSESEAGAWCAFDSSDEFQACAKTLKDEYHMVSWHAVTRCASNNMEQMLGCIKKRLGDKVDFRNGQAYQAVIQSGLEIYEPGAPLARARHYGKNTGSCSPYGD